MNHRPLILSAALALALASPAASAMGLGQLQVKSGLNQPLVAEIPIISATASELEQLDVRLASPEAFARVGLDQPGELTANLQFSVGKNTRGQPVIRVTTPTRFTEPLLSFLIEAQWGKGVVTREYSALIDPPYIAPAIVKPLLTPAIAAAPPPPVEIATPAPMRDAPAVQAPATRPVAESAPAPSEPLPAAPTPAEVAPPPQPIAAEPMSQPDYVPPPPAPAPEPVAVAPEPAPAPMAEPEPQPAHAPIAAEPPPEPAATPVEPAPKPASPEHVGPIKPGQTLSGIAGNLGTDAGVSVNQMMIALLHANPDAFDANNVNRLRSGSVLRVPGQDEVKQLSAAEAAMLVREQANSWRTPRQAVPQPVEAPAPAEPPPAHDIAAAPPTPKPESKPEPKPAGKPEPKPEPKPAPTPEPIAKAAPIASKPAGPTPVAPPQVASKPARPASRLEIVPPAGDARARGAQSGAASGAGGTELRAELVQAREDLAAKTSEVGELQSRLSDLEKQQADRQRLIDLQNSKLKELQDRLQQMEAAKAAAPAAVAAAPAPGGAPAQTGPATPASPPWYMHPYLLAGALLVLLGAIVLGLRRRKPGSDPEARGSRLSDDEALRASMAKTREAGERIRRDPAPVATVPPVDSDLQSRLDAVSQRPQDLEARLNLLRLYHARGDALQYEQAAQSMRGQVPSTLDPRWREAVVMGAALLPGHALFGQAGWNTPRFEAESGKPAATPAEPAPVPAAEPSAPAGAAVPARDPATVRVFDPPADYESALQHESPLIRDEPDLSELNLDDHATVFGNAFGAPPTDIHRSEAEIMAEDQSSSTRIELAKAYLDIGDVDGARSMLEEVLIEGGPSAKAEAGRILRELP